MKYYLTVFSLLPILLSGQKPDIGNWWIYFGDKKFNHKWNWHHEMQYRNYNFIGNTEQLLLRTGIGFNLTENNNNILVGYGFVHSQPYFGNSDDKIHVNEHRIYQQFITRQSFGRLSIQHRYRLEQRFIETDFRQRFRYFLSFNLSLTKKENSLQAIYLSAYNEIFLNMKKDYFDRNRIYSGIGYRFSKTLRTEIGFMNQTTNMNSRNQFNVIAFVNI